MRLEGQNRRDTGWVAAVLSLVAALAASMVLLILPVVAVQGEVVVYNSERSSLTGAIRRDETLVEHQGWSVVAVLAFPVIVASLPVIVARHGRFRSLRTVSAVVLAVFVLLTGLSIGLFYVPSALVMIVSAALR